MMSRNTASAVCSAVGLAGLGLVACAGPAHASGMPQLDFSSPLMLGQVVWGGVIFLLFYLILKYSALPRVEKTLAARSNAIRHDLDMAEEARDEALRLREEERQLAQDASAQAHTNINQAISQVHLAMEREGHEAQERLQKRLRESTARIEAARAQALTALRQIAQDTTHDLVVRLTGREVPPQPIEAAIDQATSRRGH